MNSMELNSKSYTSSTFCVNPGIRLRFFELEHENIPSLILLNNTLFDKYQQIEKNRDYEIPFFLLYRRK